MPGLDPAAALVARVPEDGGSIPTVTTSKPHRSPRPSRRSVVMKPPIVRGDVFSASIALRTNVVLPTPGWPVRNTCRTALGDIRSDIG